MALDFGLPPDAPPTSARLDSAFIENKPTAYEAMGEPPMVSRVDTIEAGYGNFTEIDTGGHRAFVVHLELNDSAAVRAVRAVGADSVWLGWCQRDRSSSFLVVPLVRR